MPMPLTNHAKAQLAGMLRFVQLHTGDPGPDGNANPAKQTLRVPITLDAAGLNTTALQWPLCPAIEAFTHVSLWDAATAGNPWASGALASPEPVVPNQLFEIAAGKLQVSLK
jgi:hypothetical protein